MQITCYNRHVQLQQGLVGTELFGTITTNSRITFYVLSSSEYSGYLSASSSSKTAATICAKLVPPSSHLSYNVVSSYSFNWAVPDSDNYYFVFSNPSSTDALVSFSYWSQQLVTVTPTHAQYTSTTAQPTSAELQTNTSNSPTGSSSYFTAIEIGIALIIVGAALAYIYVGKKRHTNQTLERPREKTTSKIVDVQESKPKVTEPARAKGNLGKQFCLECGNELPTGSKFCNKCGTKQS